MPRVLAIHTRRNEDDEDDGTPHEDRGEFFELGVGLGWFLHDFSNGVGDPVARVPIRLVVVCRARD